MNWKKEVYRLGQERDKRCSMFLHAVRLSQENLRLSKENEHLKSQLMASKEREAVIVNFCNEKGKHLHLIHQYFPDPRSVKKEI